MALIAHRVERVIARLAPEASRRLAYVPPLWYHITVVNRTHYRVSTSITELTADELHRAEQATRGIVGAPLTVILSGLLLTPQGVLLVPGYPADDTLFRWRQTLMATVPELGVHPPPTVHVKLAHLLVEVTGERLNHLLDFIARCGQQIGVRIRFTDAHTPRGHLHLSGDS